MKLVLFIVLFILTGCTSGKKSTKSQTSGTIEFIPLFSNNQPTFVYKTNANYNNLVPVLLSDDKSEIISYPDPKDLKAGYTYLLPTLLAKGYLLDNKGINKNVAFLKLSYQEYSELKEIPSVKDLYGYIFDKEPLFELCDCGDRSAFLDITNQLNNIIENNKLQTVCKTIK